MGFLFSFLLLYYICMEGENKKIINVKVETYASDMAKAIEVGKGGFIKKIIHEQDEKEELKTNLSPQSARNRKFMMTGIILFLVAFTSLIVVSIFREKWFTVTIKPQFIPIVFMDKNEIKDVSDLKKEQISEVVYKEVQNTDVKKGGVEGVYLKDKNGVVGLRKFVNLIAGNFVPGKEVFVSDNFLMGISNKDTKNLFFLIKVRSFPDVFDSFKAWESKMFYDLHGFFGIEINSDTEYLLTKDFEDSFVENKNARALYDNDRNIVLMYVYADDTSVIIADSQDVIKEVKLRLASSQIRK